jgi:hypothetical protein
LFEDISLLLFVVSILFVGECIPKLELLDLVNVMLVLLLLGRDPCPQILVILLDVLDLLDYLLELDQFFAVGVYVLDELHELALLFLLEFQDGLDRLLLDVATHRNVQDESEQVVDLPLGEEFLLILAAESFKLLGSEELCDECENLKKLVILIEVLQFAILQLSEVLLIYFE